MKVLPTIPALPQQANLRRYLLDLHSALQTEVKPAATATVRADPWSDEFSGGELDYRRRGYLLTNAAGDESVRQGLVDYEDISSTTLEYYSSQGGTEGQLIRTPSMDYSFLSKSVAAESALLQCRVWRVYPTPCLFGFRLSDNLGDTGNLIEIYHNITDISIRTRTAGVLDSAVLYATTWDHWTDLLFSIDVTVDRATLLCTKYKLVLQTGDKRAIAGTVTLDTTVAGPLTVPSIPATLLRAGPTLNPPGLINGWFFLDFLRRSPSGTRLEML